MYRSINRLFQRDKYYRLAIYALQLRCACIFDLHATIHRDRTSVPHFHSYIREHVRLNDYTRREINGNYIAYVTMMHNMRDGVGG